MIYLVVSGIECSGILKQVTEAFFTTYFNSIDRTLCSSQRALFCIDSILFVDVIEINKVPDLENSNQNLKIQRLLSKPFFRKNNTFSKSATRI